MVGAGSSLVEAFSWLVIVAKDSTVDNIRRGMASSNILDICVMYGKVEIVNHLFLHCEGAVSVWRTLLGDVSLGVVQRILWRRQILGVVFVSMVVGAYYGG